MKPAFHAYIRIYDPNHRGYTSREVVVNHLSPKQQRDYMIRALVGYDEHCPIGPGQLVWPCPVVTKEEPNDK